jgi:hypothetical protein
MAGQRSPPAFAPVILFGGVIWTIFFFQVLVAPRQLAGTAR